METIYCRVRGGGEKYKEYLKILKIFFKNEEKEDIKTIKLRLIKKKNLMRKV